MNPIESLGCWDLSAAVCKESKQIVKIKTKILVLFHQGATDLVIQKMFYKFLFGIVNAFF